MELGVKKCGTFYSRGTARPGWTLPVLTDQRHVFPGNKSRSEIDRIINQTVSRWGDLTEHP